MVSTQNKQMARFFASVTERMSRTDLDLDHLLLNVVVPSCSSAPRAITAALLGSMPSAASAVRRGCTRDPSSVLSRAEVFP